MKRRSLAVFDRIFRKTGPPARVRSSPTGSVSLKVATYNVHSCIDTARSVNTEKIAAVIARMNADAVALQEVDVHKPRSGHAHQPQWLADRLDMNYRFFPLIESGNGKYGLAILTRLPMKDIKFDRLPALALKRPREVRGAMWVQLRTQFGPVQMVNTHLGLLAAERRMQIEGLMGKEWLGAWTGDEPLVICGDFNAGRHSYVYRRLGKEFSDVRGFHVAAGAGATFLSYFPMLCLDHIFVSRHMVPVNMAVPSTPPARTASDHLPVFAELVATELSAI
jgi:endonuclease/exonuclease/phosphatase family metal-dependent hydrolase